MTNMINGVKVTSDLADMTYEEAARYVEYVTARVTGVTEITVTACNDGCVDVSYTAHGEPFERIRRITGYLVGTLERWNDAKKAEERERVKHGGDSDVEHESDSD